MKKLLILIRPDSRQVSKIASTASENDIKLHELLANVFVAESGVRGILDEPLRRALAGTTYVLGGYTAARANTDDWKNVLGPYGESRVGEAGTHDRYVLLRRVGGDAYIRGFVDDLSSIGISARELAPGVYVAQPSEVQAVYFSAKLGALIDDLDGDVAVLRLGLYTASIAI